MAMEMKQGAERIQKRCYAGLGELVEPVSKSYLRLHAVLSIILMSLTAYRQAVRGAGNKEKSYPIR
jgi:hypothetical protein